MRQGRRRKTCSADEERGDERAYGGPPCDGLGDRCLLLLRNNVCRGAKGTHHRYRETSSMMTLAGTMAEPGGALYSRRRQGLGQAD